MKFSFMARRRRFDLWPLLAVCIALLATWGCSRPVSVPTDQSTARTPQPFQDEDTGTKADSAGSGEPAKDSGPPAQNNLPFHDSQNLPAGTLVTVRLKTPVYANGSNPHASFEATVVEPVVVEGNTLIPTGASVAGRVESARTSKVQPNRGYVSLALQSVQLGGLSFPVRTANLFAREAPLSDGASMIHLEKGRRLTFRLTEAAYTSNQRAQLRH